MTLIECTIGHMLEPEDEIRAHVPGPDMLMAGGTLRSFEASASSMTIEEEK